MRRALAVLLCGALVLLAAAQRGSAAIERPQYVRGDSWSYRTILAAEFGLRLEGNTTITVGTAIEIDVQGETQPALELSVQGGGAFSGSFAPYGEIHGTWTITGAQHWETFAWRTVHAFFRLTATGTITGSPQPVPVALEFVNETTRRTISDTFLWPIAEGSAGETRAQWNVSQIVSVAFGSTPPDSLTTYWDAEVVTSHEHIGTRGVTVPAGTFDAHQIEESVPGGGHVVRWFAPRVGGDVRREEYNATDVLVVSSELTAFRYRAGEPAPPFPWMYAILAGLGASAGVLLIALAARGRRPMDLWMPPEPESRDRSP